jgi:hypothetical protein
MATEFKVGKKKNDSTDYKIKLWLASAKMFCAKYRKILWIVAAVIAGLSFWALGWKATLEWIFLLYVIYLFYSLSVPAVMWLYKSIAMSGKKSQKKEGVKRIVKFGVVMMLIIAAAVSTGTVLKHTEFGLAVQRVVFGYNDTVVTPIIYGDWETSKDRIDTLLTPTPTVSPEK